MPLDETTIYRIRGRVVIRRIGTDTLLVPVSGLAAGGKIYPVNATALCVWTCITEGATVRQAAKRLAESYQVSEPQALDDCHACVRAFLEESLIEVNPS